MPNYRRTYIAGGTYFITQVTYQRQALLCSKITRTALLCQVPQQWQFSSLHRLIVEGMYAADWGMDGKGVEPLSWDGGE